MLEPYSLSCTEFVFYIIKSVSVEEKESERSGYQREVTFLVGVWES